MNRVVVLCMGVIVLVRGNGLVGLDSKKQYSLIRRFGVAGSREACSRIPHRARGARTRQAPEARSGDRLHGRMGSESP